MKTFKWGGWALAGILAVSLGAFTGCKKDETASESFDRNSEKAKDSLKDAGEKTKDALNKAGDKLKEASNTNK